MLSDCSTNSITPILAVEPTLNIRAKNSRVKLFKSAAVFFKNGFVHFVDSVNLVKIIVSDRLKLKM